MKASFGLSFRNIEKVVYAQMDW